MQYENGKDYARVDGCTTIDQHSELPRHTTGPSERPRRTRRLRGDPATRALLKFARVMETVTERERHAAICWLADKYLSVKIY